MSESDPVDQVVRDITSRPADFDNTADPRTKAGALAAAADGIRRRHVGTSADEFVAAALKNRFERVSEPSETPDMMDPEYLDPYYVDAANRKQAGLQVETELNDFSAETAAFGQTVDYWNKRVEKEVIEVALEALRRGERPLSIAEAYKIWDETRGPGGVSKRMRALFTKRPVTERGNPVGSGELEAERKRRVRLYQKPQRTESAATKKGAFDVALARVSR